MSTPAPAPEGERFEEGPLVRQAQEGRSGAFDELIRRHGPRIFRYLHQLLRHRQDAEDLAQQTFVKAYHHLASFDASRPMLPWLIAIARRNALNHFRSARPWVPFEDTEEAAGAIGPDAAAESSDRARNLWERARARLSPREFEVMWLRFGEDLSTRETARITGLTQPHVKILVFRAKRSLRKGLSHE